MMLWTIISNLADTKVMVPLALACAAGLLLGRAWRMAFWWCLLFLVGLALVAVTKIAFIGWGIGIRSLDFTGFSGHAMRATAIMPVLFYLLLQKASRFVRVSGIICGLALGVLIGVSRLAVHVHSVSEVVSGCILGAMVALGFIWLSNSLQKPVLYRWLIVLSLLVLIPSPMAKPAPTNLWLENISLYLSGHDKPFVRGYSETPDISR